MSDGAKTDSLDWAAAQQRIQQAFDAGAALTRPEPAEHKVPSSIRVPVANVKQAPFDSIGLLVCQGSSTLFGTAVYCAPNAVLTAKHTFDVPNIQSAWLYIGFDAKQNPVTPAKVVALQLHPNLDLAVLIIDAAPRTALNLAGAKVLEGQPVIVSGYGIPYGDGSMQLSVAGGIVTDATANLLGYGVTTSKGDSGAPVLMKTASGAYTVVGIHTSGDNGLPSGSNFGIPMTPPYVAEVQKLLALANKSASN